MSYGGAPQQQYQQQRGGGGQQNQGGQQAGGVVSKAPVMRISGAPQFIVPPSPKPEPERPGKQWTLDKLRETDGVVPPQYGSNQFASQRGMTGFGTARDVGGKHLHRFWEALGPNECVGLDQNEFQFGGNISGAQMQQMQQRGQGGQQGGQGQQYQQQQPPQGQQYQQQQQY